MEMMEERIDAENVKKLCIWNILDTPLNTEVNNLLLQVLQQMLQI